MNPDIFSHPILFPLITVNKKTVEIALQEKTSLDKGLLLLKK
jgi:hypothetical protein